MFKKKIFEKQITKTPKNVLWCKKCTISNQRPRIIFNTEGICSACVNVERKKKINWKEREIELLDLLNQHRSKDGRFDVIVPSSGGKDSNYVAHILKYKYNMNPLTVTFSPIRYTDIGRKNFYSAINSGFSNILCTPNGITQKLLARLCFEELGDAFHIFVLGQMNLAFHFALKLKIKLVFFGENGELEYAGVPSSKDLPFKPFEKFQDHHFKGSDLFDIIQYGKETKDYIKNNIKNLQKSDLSFYTSPPYEELIKNKIFGKYFFSYFKNWNPQENYYYASKYTGFQANTERSEGTYSRYASLDDRIDGMHYYMRYIKFGLGRCSEETAHEIREGHITREEGVRLMHKYDGEFPNKYFQDFLQTLDIDQSHFWDVVNEWRQEHLWKKDGNKYTLKNPIK